MTDQRLWRLLRCDGCRTVHDMLDLTPAVRIEGKRRRYCGACWKEKKPQLRMNDAGWYFTTE